MDYLGHLINSNGIKPLEDNIRAIQRWFCRINQPGKQANEFIGGLGFYRKFIRNFSKIALPIHQTTNLTRKNRHKFQWGEEQRGAVEQLKRAITGPELVLDFPDPHRPFRLATGTSQTGLGAVLKQVTTDGHPEAPVRGDRVPETEARALGEGRMDTDKTLLQQIRDKEQELAQRVDTTRAEADASIAAAPGRRSRRPALYLQTNSGRQPQNRCGKRREDRDRDQGVETGSGTGAGDRSGAG